jgi:tRNA uridine 5-carboxymethylaminomethyl modification enzyme
LGLLDEAELRLAAQRFAQEEQVLALARATTVTPSAAAPVLAPTGTRLEEPERVANVARRPGVSLRALLDAAGVAVAADEAAVESAAIELKYDGYLAREREAAARLAELASFALPGDLPYPDFRSLATEARHKLDQVRPTSLAQAARVPGVSPSDLHNLVIETLRWRRRVA